MEIYYFSTFSLAVYSSYSLRDGDRLEIESELQAHINTTVPIHLGTAIDWKDGIGTVQTAVNLGSYSLRDGDRLERA